MNAWKETVRRHELEDELLGENGAPSSAGRRLNAQMSTTDVGHGNGWKPAVHRQTLMG